MCNVRNMKTPVHTVNLTQGQLLIYTLAWEPGVFAAAGTMQLQL